MARIILIQVPDTQTEDDIDMAIMGWNDRVKAEYPDRVIHYNKTSVPIVTEDQLRR